MTLYGQWCGHRHRTPEACQPCVRRARREWGLDPSSIGIAQGCSRGYSDFTVIAAVLPQEVEVTLVKRASDLVREAVHDPRPAVISFDEGAQ